MDGIKLNFVVLIFGAWKPEVPDDHTKYTGDADAILLVMLMLFEFVLVVDVAAFPVRLALIVEQVSVDVAGTNESAVVDMFAC